MDSKKMNSKEKTFVSAFLVVIFALIIYCCNVGSDSNEKFFKEEDRISSVIKTFPSGKILYVNFPAGKDSCKVVIKTNADSSLVAVLVDDATAMKLLRTIRPQLYGNNSTSNK